MRQRSNSKTLPVRPSYVQHITLSKKFNPRLPVPNIPSRLKLHSWGVRLSRQRQE